MNAPTPTGTARTATKRVTFTEYSAACHEMRTALEAHSNGTARPLDVARAALVLAQVAQSLSDQQQGE